ncbi:hypothetical protein THH46_11645 [Pseudomonas sp. NA13]
MKQIWRHSELDSSNVPAVLRELVRYATLAPSSHNTQCWKFGLDDQSISIRPDYQRRCPIVDPDDHHLLSASAAPPRTLCRQRQRWALGVMPFSIPGKTNHGTSPWSAQRRSELRFSRQFRVGSRPGPNLMPSLFQTTNCGFWK